MEMAVEEPGATAIGGRRKMVGEEIGGIRNIRINRWVKIRRIRRRIVRRRQFIIMIIVPKHQI